MRVFVHFQCSVYILYPLRVLFVELQEFSGKVEKRLAKRTVKTYGNSNTLHSRTLSRHPAFPDFVTGSTTGEGTHFHCRVCKRDVAMKAQGSGEFSRHFRSDAHWFKDVTYRVHMGLQVLNRLMEPMELSASQLADYKSRPFCDLSGEYPFPEDLLPKHSKAESNVPYMTLVSCFCEFLRNGGDFDYLRRLWGHFRATLGDREPCFPLRLSRSETVVSWFGYCYCLFPSCIRVREKQKGMGDVFCSCFESRVSFVF